jgi:hypothetical protein
MTSLPKCIWGLLFLVISSSITYAKSLEKKYSGLSVPRYKLMEWYDDEKQVFFDCNKADKNACLAKILEKTDIPEFVVFFIAKENGAYSFTDVSYRNLGKETLNHFVTRYEKQLMNMTKMSLQLRKIEYVQNVGFSYEQEQ